MQAMAQGLEVIAEELDQIRARLGEAEKLIVKWRSVAVHPRWGFGRGRTMLACADELEKAITQPKPIE